jgi:hypothetical protein
MLKLLTRLRSTKTSAEAMSRRQALPFQPMRLSFSTMNEYESFRARFPKVFDQVWHWQTQFGNRGEAFTFYGICEICDSPTEFRAQPRASGKPAFPHTVNWWSGTKCRTCRLMMRDRVMARFLLEGAIAEPSLYHIGHPSHLRNWLRQHYPQAVSAQFSQGRGTDSTAGDVPIEDLSMRGIANSTHDVVMVGDVLEHVPSHLGALSAMARVLKKGGTALLALPWAGQQAYEHVLTTQTGGTSASRVPAAPYHRDPQSGECFLRHRIFGWKILDELRAAGFSRASAEYLFAPVHGYMLLHPLIAAVK